MSYNPALIKAMQVRFVAPEDVERYGDDWHTYDELAIVTTPAKALMLLEGEIGAPLTEVMNGMRVSSVFGDTCAAWIALRMEGHSVPFADFNPAILLAEWRVKLDDEEATMGKDVESTPATEADPPPVSSSPAHSTDPADIVSLPIMEPTEWRS